MSAILLLVELRSNKKLKVNKTQPYIKLPPTLGVLEILISSLDPAAVVLRRWMSEVE